MDKHLDKENFKKKTKLPLPVATTPILPCRLPKKLSDRPPLNTLAGPNGHHHNVPARFDSNTESFAGPSNSIINRPKIPSRFDTRFVTLTRGSDFSDYDSVVGKEETIFILEPCIIISDSSDDEHDAKEEETYFTDKDDLANKKGISASTPALHALQPARVRNIKRSLKRLHSRELQGYTPLGNQERGDKIGARRRLNFNQSVCERMQSPDYLQKSYVANLAREYSWEIFSYLEQVESKHASVPRLKSEMRACVINWLMKINGVDGNPATIQTAVWYLDEVLATANVPLENIQLIAAACYWIAAKIHGPVTPAAMLVKYANHAFTAKRLLEIEKIILIRLNFPRQPVIPQDYLYYFAWWCNREHPGELEVATTYLCLCGLMMNKRLCSEYPSVVAAASAMNALLLLRKTELMPRLQSCPAIQAAEKKAKNLTHTCTILRDAARAVAAKDKFIFEQYGMPPMCIAQTLASAAVDIDTRDIQAYWSINN